MPTMTSVRMNVTTFAIIIGQFHTLKKAQRMQSRSGRSDQAASSLRSGEGVIAGFLDLWSDRHAQKIAAGL